MNEEPLVIKHNKKIKLIVPKTNDNIYIPVKLWFELILKNLGLVDLITIKRTCKSFACSKDIKSLIKDKTNTSFSKINKLHWNKINIIKNSNVIKDVFIMKHSGKFLFIKSIGLYNFNSKFMLGAFSSKKLLFEQFLTNYTTMYSKYLSHKTIKYDYIMISHGERS